MHTIPSSAILQRRDRSPLLPCALVTSSLDFTEAAREFIEEAVLKANVKRYVVVHPSNPRHLVAVLALEEGWLTFVGSKGLARSCSGWRLKSRDVTGRNV